MSGFGASDRRSTLRPRPLRRPHTSPPLGGSENASGPSHQPLIGSHPRSPDPVGAAPVGTAPASPTASSSPLSDPISLSTPSVSVVASRSPSLAPSSLKEEGALEVGSPEASGLARGAFSGDPEPPMSAKSASTFDAGTLRLGAQQGRRAGGARAQDDGERPQGGGQEARSERRERIRTRRSLPRLLRLLPCVLLLAAFLMPALVIIITQLEVQLATRPAADPVVVAVLPLSPDPVTTLINLTFALASLAPTFLETGALEPLLYQNIDRTVESFCGSVSSALYLDWFHARLRREGADFSFADMADELERIGPSLTPETSRLHELCEKIRGDLAYLDVASLDAHYTLTDWWIPRHAKPMLDAAARLTWQLSEAASGGPGGRPSVNASASTIIRKLFWITVLPGDLTGRFPDVLPIARRALKHLEEITKTEWSCIGDRGRAASQGPQSYFSWLYWMSRGNSGETGETDHEKAAVILEDLRVWEHKLRAAADAHVRPVQRLLEIYPDWVSLQNQLAGLSFAGKGWEECVVVLTEDSAAPRGSSPRLFKRKVEQRQYYLAQTTEVPGRLLAAGRELYQQAERLADKMWAADKDLWGAGEYDTRTQLPLWDATLWDMFWETRPIPQEIVDIVSEFWILPGQMRSIFS